MSFEKLATLFVAFAILASCASNGTESPKSETPTTPAEQPAKAGELPPQNPNEVFRPGRDTPKEKVKPPKKNARVTIDQSVINFGEAVRAVGTQAGGNIVLMNGLESRTLQGLQIKRLNVRDATTALAAASGTAMEDHPNYYFIFPDGYEQLLSLSLNGRLAPRYNEIKTEAVFGSGLPLCSVFMWMSYALKVSIVADNSIGDARCGELALREVPLETAIEAILKSARVAVTQVDSTPDYIFLSAPANTNPASALLDEASLGDQQKAILEKRVSLVLPYALKTGQPLELPLNPSPLGHVLPALTEQLGVRVVAEKSLEKFPVNPMCVQNVTVRTALDLLVRQWLEPNYGYQVLEDRIVIRSR